jgi:hypothetical protein
MVLAEERLLDADAEYLGRLWPKSQPAEAVVHRGEHLVTHQNVS